MEKEKGKKKLKIALIIAIVIILGMSGYIVYDKVLSKDTTPVRKTVENNVQEEFDKNVASEILSSYYFVDYTEEKDSMGYLYKKDKITSSNISDEIKIIVAINQFYPDDVKEYDEDHTQIEKDKIETKIKSMFKDGNINHKSVSNYCPSITYSKDSYLLDSRCGGIDYSYLEENIVSAYKKKNTLEIVVKPAFKQWINEEEDNRKYDVYTVDKRTKLASGLGVNEESNYINKLDSYKIVFEIDNNNYLLDKVEKVK